MKKGAVIELTVEKLAYKGLGIGYTDVENQEKVSSKMVVFVPNMIPGEKAEVMIIKKKKNYMEGRKLRKLTPSPMEIEAPCPYFGVCGGCKWQHMPYEEQLKVKEGFITEALEKMGKLQDNYEVLPIIPSPEQYHYRNKIELSFGTLPFVPQGEYQAIRTNETEREVGNYLGYHGSGSFNKIVDVDACMLMGKVSDAVIALIKEFVKKKQLSAYDQKTHDGFFRHIIMRHGHNTGEWMVNLITNTTEDYTEEFFQPLVEDILMLEKEGVKFESILWTQNDSLSDTAVGKDIRTLHGREYIFDKVGEYMFKISPYSFFQTNTHGAEKLYDLTKKFADLKGGEIIIDLYSGTGTIGMYLAKDAKKVYAMESVASAVEDARVNATMNNILNIEFMEGKVEKEAAKLVFERPDVVIIDPPRAGMHPKALQLLPMFKAPKIVYVSCNPTTLARDLEYLSTWYTVKKVQGVDMFPQTYHVETVVELERK